MDGLKCIEVPPDKALEIWPELQPYIVQALSYDLYNSISLGKIQAQIAGGFARVLICGESSGQLLSATVITLFKNTKDERILHVIATAGKGSEKWLRQLIDKLQEIAQDENCAAVTMAGRPGWTKKLARHGFKTEQVSMRLETNGRTQQKSEPERSAIALIR